MEMDHATLEQYWRAITVIEAQDALIALKVADFPYQNRNDRQRTHRQFHKLAYPRSASGDVLSTKELSERLKAVFNG